ncbi:hypothetical protein DMUE_1360 [Dictyocoela muelleri]|nr:hypothetical protein DMUE_1360 [Dictyocoela muelleri]
MNDADDKKEKPLEHSNNNEILKSKIIKNQTIEFQMVNPEYLNKKLSGNSYFEHDDVELNFITNNYKLSGSKNLAKDDSGCFGDLTEDNLNESDLIGVNLSDKDVKNENWTWDNLGDNDLVDQDLAIEDLDDQDLTIDDCQIEAWEIDDSKIEIYLKIEDSTGDDVSVEEYIDMPDHLLQNYDDGKIESASIKNENDGENEYYVEKTSDDKINKNKNIRATIDMTKTVVLNVYDPHYPCEDVKKFIELNGSPWKDKK